MPFLIIKFLILVVVLHQFLYWVWLWQLKEYRRDRFWAGVKDGGWRVFWLQYDLRHWPRPRLTLRAVVTFVVALLGISPIMLVVAPLWAALAVGDASPVFIFWKEVVMWWATRKMAGFKGTIIGVTGSYGKSMTKEMLRQVLGTKFKVVATVKNDNSEIGVALTILKKLRGDEDFFVVEMGAYKRGEIAKICKMVRPRIGIVTGIGDQHLDLFGSLENIRRAKLELINSLPADGLGLVGGEDFRLADAKNLRQFKDHLEFSYEQQKYSVPLLGTELARNVVGIIKVARQVGMAAEQIATALKNLDTTNIYPRLLVGKKGTTVVDNSYNNNLEGLLSALEYLTVWHGYQKIVVTPGFIELGTRAVTDWEAVVQKAKQVGAKIAIVRGGDEVNFALKPKMVVLLQGRVPRQVKDYVQSV